MTKFIPRCAKSICVQAEGSKTARYVNTKSEEIMNGIKVRVFEFSDTPEYFGKGAYKSAMSFVYDRMKDTGIVNAAISVGTITKDQYEKMLAEKKLTNVNETSPLVTYDEETHRTYNGSDETQMIDISNEWGDMGIDVPAGHYYDWRTGHVLYPDGVGIVPAYSKDRKQGPAGSFPDDITYDADSDITTNTSPDIQRFLEVVKGYKRSVELKPGEGYNHATGKVVPAEGS